MCEHESILRQAHETCLRKGYPNAYKLYEALDVPSQGPANVEWQDPFGVWSDLPDTMLDDLDQIRHASRPTPPLELP